MRKMIALWILTAIGLLTLTVINLLNYGDGPSPVVSMPVKVIDGEWVVEGVIDGEKKFEMFTGIGSDSEVYPATVRISQSNDQGVTGRGSFASNSGGNREVIFSWQWKDRDSVLIVDGNEYDISQHPIVRIDSANSHPAPP